MRRVFVSVALVILLVAAGLGVYFGVFHRQGTVPERTGAEQPGGVSEETVVGSPVGVAEPAAVEEPSAEESSTETAATVERVIDGDTFVLTTGEEVRLIGFNTPEEERNCYLLAKERLEGLVQGKDVRLEPGLEDRDQYGRLLRYVFVDDVSVTEVMVREGLGYVYVVGEGLKYQAELEEAERLAKQEGGCVWKASPECPGCIKIAAFHYDAEGDDCENLNDEFVIFVNTCNYTCVMTGWSVKDEASRPPFIFNELELGTNAKITLYTGFGEDTDTELYWGNTGYSCNAIWNNKGDTLFLRDGDGELVLEHKY